ncbi:hypothetical protein KQX54_000771 [Cotesia glomerata]|uniref:Uncharacterized protein n=1 Tax=Cotesia glomerata TaxID=32391 RepID=A0AAV7I737_COTGL|nr:hypothetical protein KQX54_000771 [Cotesia glomerata]
MVVRMFPSSDDSEEDEYKSFKEKRKRSLDRIIKKVSYEQLDHLFKKFHEILWRKKSFLSIKSIRFVGSGELHCSRGLGGLLGDEMGLGKTDFVDLVQRWLYVQRHYLSNGFNFIFHDWWPVQCCNTPSLWNTSSGIQEIYLRV